MDIPHQICGPHTHDSYLKAQNFENTHLSAVSQLTDPIHTNVKPLKTKTMIKLRNLIAHKTSLSLNTSQHS